MRFATPITITIVDSAKPLARRSRTSSARSSAEIASSRRAREPRSQMPLDRVAVALPRRRPQIDDRPGSHRSAASPKRRRGVRDDAFASPALRQELVPDCSRGGDAAVHGPPSLPAGSVLESDLIDTRRPLVDIAIDPYAPTRGISSAHDGPLRRRVQYRRQMAGPPARATPRVEVDAAEIQLAASALLLGRDRSLGRELPRRVAMNAEVLGRATRVEALDVGVVCGT